MGISRISEALRLAPFAALFVALIVCVFAEPTGKYLAVMDVPDGARKHHSQPTPLVGGIAVMLSLIVWGSLTFALGRVAGDAPLLIAVLLCGTGAALVGFADDQSSTLPLVRASSLVVFLLVAFAIDRDLIVPALNWGSFPPLALPTVAMCALLSIAMVGYVNAVNMADGQNGIVSGMYATWSLCLILIGSGTILTVSQLLLASIVIVLAFNLAGRLFLGDCGTYGVSFVFGLLAIAAHAKGLVSVETIAVWFFLPVVDCLRLVIMRPMRGVSPVDAGRDHFHHRLQIKLGHSFGLLTYVSIVAVSSLIATIEPRFALVCLIALAAIYFSFAWLTDEAALAAKSASTSAPASSNVIPISEGDASRKSREAH